MNRQPHPRAGVWRKSVLLQSGGPSRAGAAMLVVVAEAGTVTKTRRFSPRTMEVRRAARGACLQFVP